MLTCFIYQMDMFVIAAQDHFSFFCFGNVSFLVTTFGVVSQPALLVHSSPTHSLPQCLIPSKSYTTLIIVSFVSRPLLFIYSFIFFWWRWDIVDDCFILCFILCGRQQTLHGGCLTTTWHYTFFPFSSITCSECWPIRAQNVPCTTVTTAQAKTNYILSAAR